MTLKETKMLEYINLSRGAVQTPNGLIGPTGDLAVVSGNRIKILEKSGRVVELPPERDGQVIYVIAREVEKEFPDYRRDFIETTKLSIATLF